MILFVAPPPRSALKKMARAGRPEHQRLQKPLLRHPYSLAGPWQGDNSHSSHIDGILTETRPRRGVSLVRDFFRSNRFHNGPPCLDLNSIGKN